MSSLLFSSQVSRSLVHCAVQCKSTPDCAAANYNQQTSTCEMMKLSLALTDDPGNRAIRKEGTEALQVIARLK